jgi:hypothetical protein
MRLAAPLLFATASVAALAAPAASDHQDGPRLQGSYKFHRGGWTYVHLQGTAEQFGFQHGYLLARQIEDNVHVFGVKTFRARVARVDLA